MRTEKNKINELRDAKGEAGEVVKDLWCSYFTEEINVLKQQFDGDRGCIFNTILKKIMKNLWILCLTL